MLELYRCLNASLHLHQNKNLPPPFQPSGCKMILPLIMKAFVQRKSISPKSKKEDTLEVMLLLPQMNHLIYRDFLLSGTLFPKHRKPPFCTVYLKLALE